MPRRGQGAINGRTRIRRTKVEGKGVRMTGTVISLAHARVQRNCRRILDSNSQTLRHVESLRDAHRSIADSLDSVRDGLVEFSDSLGRSIEQLRDSGRRQQTIMDRIEEIQRQSAAFR